MLHSPLALLILGILWTRIRAELNTNWKVDSTSTPADLCQRLKSGNASQLQGVSVTKQHLYIVERDYLYRVPLTSRFLDWNKGRLALFDRASRLESPEEHFERLTHWLQVPRIEQTLAANAIRWHELHLLRMSVVGDEEARVWMDLRYERFTGDRVSQVETLLVSSELIAKQAPTPKIVRQVGEPPENVVADWAMERVLVFTVDHHQWIRVEQLEDFHRATMYIELQVGRLNDRTLLFHAQQPQVPYAPLFTSLPVFGFTFGQLMQLWDVNRRQVHLATVLPQPHNLTDMPIPIMTVPFAEYFACNSNDWGVDAEVPEKLEPPPPAPVAPTKSAVTGFRTEPTKTSETTTFSEAASIAWVVVLVVLILCLLDWSHPA